MGDGKEPIRTVLVIDDDELVLESCKAILEAAGYAVTTAPNGLVGEQLFERHPADVVVCDIFMPEQDGIETMLRLSSDYVGARIIAMSGGSMGGLDLVATTRHFGAIDMLRKPFGADELVGAVRSALEVDE